MAACNCHEKNCHSNKKGHFTNEAAIFKALAHPSRLLMLDALREGKRCVCELQEIVGSDISTVSKHLKILKDSQIVQIEKEGNFIYYHLMMPCVLDFLDCVSKERGCSCSSG